MAEAEEGGGDKKRGKGRGHVKGSSDSDGAKDEMPVWNNVRRNVYVERAPFKEHMDDVQVCGGLPCRNWGGRTIHRWVGVCTTRLGVRNEDRPRSARLDDGE